MLTRPLSSYRDPDGLEDVRARLIAGVQARLGKTYVGAYLQGSLETGGFQRRWSCGARDVCASTANFNTHKRRRGTASQRRKPLGFTDFTGDPAHPETTMPDIFHDVPIKVPPDRVFRAISTPEGLDIWWTKRSAGSPQEGSEYELWFGPDYDWRARVTRCVPDSEFEMEMVRADGDWLGTRVGLQLEARGAVTWVRFHHTGWLSLNDHFRISCNCWALYLRILRRSLEHGESVPYEKRLDV